ncbi:MAG: AAA family ATPase, partial [Chloroflexi bacterium]|nr:AAA family ATPase [Chloroflexota bacterium]
LADAPLKWQSEEFVHIARAQNELEDRLARIANRVLICDTDSWATTIWHERYVGQRSADVAAVASGRRIDRYLVTSPDIPFYLPAVSFQPPSVHTRNGRRHRSAAAARPLSVIRKTSVYSSTYSASPSTGAVCSIHPAAQKRSAVDSGRMCRTFRMSAHGIAIPPSGEPYR